MMIFPGTAVLKDRSCEQQSHRGVKRSFTGSSGVTGIHIIVCLYLCSLRCRLTGTVDFVFFCKLFPPSAFCFVLWKAWWC